MQNQGGYQNQKPMGSGGYLYRNDKKFNASSPDQKGKIKIEEDILAELRSGSREFYLSGWNKVDPKNGQTFLALKLKKIEAQGGGFSQAPAQTAPPQYAPQVPQQAPPPAYYPQPHPRPQNTQPQQYAPQAPQHSAPFPNDEIPF